MNVPLVPWHGTLRRSLTLRVDGQPAGGAVIQKVEVLQPARGAVANRIARTAHYGKHTAVSLEYGMEALKTMRSDASL